MVEKGSKFKDLETGKIEVVLDATGNSVLLTQTKIKTGGINCSQWFNDFNFKKRFEKYAK